MEKAETVRWSARLKHKNIAVKGSVGRKSDFGFVCCLGNTTMIDTDSKKYRWTIRIGKCGWFGIYVGMCQIRKAQ